MGQDPDLLPVFANKTLMEHSHPYVYTLSRCFHNTELKDCLELHGLHSPECHYLPAGKSGQSLSITNKIVINPQRRESLGKALLERTR